MKLILTQEVDGLGAPGDVVEVKDGYGRNYLVPRGLGIRWTRGGGTAPAPASLGDNDLLAVVRHVGDELVAALYDVHAGGEAGGRLGDVSVRELLRNISLLLLV